MKKISAILLLALFAACTTQLYVPSDSNVNKRESASLADLKKGHDLYLNNCGKCHKLFKPDSHTPEKWTKILEVMGPQAKLSNEQVSLVYKYLVNH